jgi:hypothetical protein
MPLPPPVLLTVRLITELETTLRDVRANGDPEIKHLARIIERLQEALPSLGRPDLQEATHELLEALNDAERGAIAPMFEGLHPGIPPTWRLILMSFALHAMAQAVAAGIGEQEAIRQLLPIVQRRIPDATAATLSNWRDQLQRKEGSSLPPEVRQRYAKGLPPPLAGMATPAERFEAIVAMLDRSIRHRRAKKSRRDKSRSVRH